MLTENELIKTPEYWMETIQNEIFRQIQTFLKEKNMTQTQFAEQLDVTKGYISQVMKGEFNYTLKKLIEISLAIGKAPVLYFQPLDNIIPGAERPTTTEENLFITQVAEPLGHFEKNSVETMISK